MIAPESLLQNDNIETLCEIAAVCPAGCFVEFGVYKGGSAWHLAKVAQEQGRDIYLYDTFEGIPFKAEVDSHVVGDFGDTSLETVAAAIPYAKISKGIFPQSLIPMPQIAFAHIDADQYDSIKAACEVLGPMMVSGGVMVFDDYNCLAGANKALDETGWVIEMTRTNKAMVRFT